MHIHPPTCQYNLLFPKLKSPRVKLVRDTVGSKDSSDYHMNLDFSSISCLQIQRFLHFQGRVFQEIVPGSCRLLFYPFRNPERMPRPLEFQRKDVVRLWGSAWLPCPSLSSSLWQVTWEASIYQAHVTRKSHPGASSGSKSTWNACTKRGFLKGKLGIRYQVKGVWGFGYWVGKNYTWDPDFQMETEEPEVLLVTYKMKHSF